MIITRKVLTGEKLVTVTVVHAPWNICGWFRIAAAWDTGVCHHFFSCRTFSAVVAFSGRRDWNGRLFTISWSNV